MTESRKYLRLSINQRTLFNWVLGEQMKKRGDVNRKEAYDFVLSKSEEELHDIIGGLKFASSNRAKDEDGVEHHRIGVISDTHIGSIYTLDEWVRDAIADLQNKGCECILHCGDLTEGIKHARLETQMYEWREGVNSYPTMRDLSIELLKDLYIPMHIISGNHDKFFQDNCDIVRDIADRVPMLNYLGFNNKTIEIGGVKILLFHGGDGYSNVRLKNLAYSEQLEHNGIKLLLAGHCHKFDIKWIDHCYCVNVPSIQQQSSWMRAKKLPADCGWLMIDFASKNGEIIDISFNYHHLE